MIPVWRPPLALDYPTVVSRRIISHLCYARHQLPHITPNLMTRTGALIRSLLRPLVSPLNLSSRLPLARQWTLENRE
jgi:hypothetical protein